MESTKMPNCTELCKIGKNTQITVDLESGPYPVKIIGSNNVDSYTFSTYLPPCIQSELLRVTKKYGQVYVLGLEYSKNGKSDVQVGVTGTYNKKLDGEMLRRTLSREVFEETGLLLDTQYVIFPKKENTYNTDKREWLCGNVHCSLLTPFTNANERASKDLAMWLSKSHKKHDDRSKKTGLVIWERSCRDMCEKLFSIEKNKHLTKILSRDDISAVCVIHLTKDILRKIISKGSSKNPVEKQKLSKPGKKDIVYYMVSMEGCGACSHAKETFKKHKLKYKEIGKTKGSDTSFSKSNLESDKNAISKFKEIKENYNYFPQIIKIDERTGKLVPWEKGERKGRYIGGNAELQEEL